MVTPVALRLQDVSIQRKLPLTVMVTSGLALVLACAAFLAYDAVTVRRAEERKLDILSEIVGAQSTVAVAFDDPKVAQEILSPLGTDREIVCAVIYGKTGKPLARFLRPDAAASRVPETAGPDGPGYEGAHFLVFRPVIQEGRRIGTVHLRSDMQETVAQLRRGVLIAVLVLLIASVAALGLSVPLGGMITRPIRDLARTVRAVSAEKDYSLQAVPQGRDEVGQLVEGFNDMLTRIRERDEALRARLDENAEAQKRLEALNRALEEQKAELGTYHDLVTHDVTNFAGTLMVIVEHLLTFPETALPPRGRELLFRANRQIFQLNALAGNAKTLMRLRQKGLPPAGQKVALGPLLQRVAETIRAVHFDRKVRTEVECPADLSIPEVPFLENVFLNLMDNAVRHGPRGEAPRVRIRVVPNGTGVRVAVSGGTPLDPAQQGKLFDRYVRGPSSKGAGLGLAVVREIVMRAGGAVEADTAQEDGKGVFRISLTFKRE